MSSQCDIRTPLGRVLRVTRVGDMIAGAQFLMTKTPVLPVADSLLRDASLQVQAYFERRLRVFNLPLQFAGTQFEQAVWLAVVQLEFAEFVSYADVARAVGHPGAHRAVAAAMAKTPIDLFIPAHRVIGANGRLKGCQPGSIRARLFAFESSMGSSSDIQSHVTDRTKPTSFENLD